MRIQEDRCLHWYTRCRTVRSHNTLVGGEGGQGPMIKGEYQVFWGVLIDLTIDLLVLIINPFDNQTEMFRDLVLSHPLIIKIFEILSNPLIINLFEIFD